MAKLLTLAREINDSSVKEPSPMENRKFAVRENELSYQILGCAIEVHRELGGPGLLESVYEEALVWELSQLGLVVDKQVELPIHYKATKLKSPLRMDLVVEGLVIVECKSTAEMHPIFKSQAQTYLHLSHLRLALVINFGMKILKDGIVRVANGLPNEPWESHRR